MREYKNESREELVRLVCNQCGKEIKLKGNIPVEGVYKVRYTWDYMSEKDGMQDSFDLCESCYDAWVKTFLIPITRTEVTEYL